MRKGIKGRTGRKEGRKIDEERGGG